MAGFEVTTEDNPDGPYQIGARALRLALRGKFAEAEALIPGTVKLRKHPRITTPPTILLLSTHSKGMHILQSNGSGRQ